MRSVLLFILTLSACAYVQAQEPDVQPQTSEQRATSLVQRLNMHIPFSPAKKDSMIIIYKNFYDEIKMYQIDGNMDVMKVLVQKRETKVQQLLGDEEQYTAYRQYLEEMKQKREQRQRQEGGQKHGGRYR